MDIGKFLKMDASLDYNFISIVMIIGIPNHMKFNSVNTKVGAYEIYIPICYVFEQSYNLAYCIIVSSLSAKFVSLCCISYTNIFIVLKYIDE